ncbi:hypothetical protein [Pseudanabaena sp. Chao 1811]|uniref:hypothetical protein n=1 Tax=Pseudanabaena sp. Chao 1811 TaxID=2963092 RepID=UPI0022F3A297|nr:hypothetical protein [Pseudanabaena sp. Chao 1811]
MAQFYNNYESGNFHEQITDITSNSLEQAQQHIYNFFLSIVKNYQADEVLNQFDKLFIRYEEIDSTKAYYALGEIIFYNKEDEFKNTLLRCCYILNNNWAINGNINLCHRLVDLFLSNSIGIPTRIYKLKKLREWLQRFVRSEEYNTLRSLSGRAGVSKSYHNWSDRFSAYLLTSEYTDCNKPIEQRQYAETLARKIKRQFKFDLAMYTARIDSNPNVNPHRPNPTTLGDGVLILIKRVLNKQGHEDLRSVAKRFRHHMSGMTLAEFKDHLLSYLGISRDDLDIPEVMRLTVVEKLKHFQEHQDQELITLSSIHIVCNRILQYLLLNERRNPSDFLQLSLESNNFLGYVILLLKVVLICPRSRLYLESYIAELIKFYSSYDEVECRSFINFLDVVNVTLAIFDEDTDYSLVKMRDLENDFPDVNLDNYRVFSQSKKLVDLASKPPSSQDTKTLIS